MSLDITLINPTPIITTGTGVFVRESGRNKELTVEEIERQWPGTNMTVEEWETVEVWSTNITHNLNNMAKEAHIYEVMWRPDEIDIEYAHQAVPILGRGFITLVQDPEYFKRMNPDNGWGTYEQLVDTVREYIIACVTYPHARIEVSR